jgi:thiamine pyrophosphokinase
MLVTTDSAPKACIFCQGLLSNPDKVRKIAGACDLLMAVNGGAKYLAELGLTPRIIFGNMDAIEKNLWKNENCRQNIRLPANQDKVEVEHAVLYAFGKGCRQVILVAALGARLDQTLGNVALLAEYPGRVAILDGTATLIAADKSEKVMLHGPSGTAVSLIPFSPGPLTVSTSGLKYDLRDENLKSVTRGLNNELARPEAWVRVSDGVMLVYLENEA